MHLVGAHVPAENGVQNAPLNAAAIGCSAFALFTRNQRQWSAPALKIETIEAFKANCAAKGFAPGVILAHDSYLINLGNPDASSRARAYDSFLDEMKRCEQLGIPALNAHPGNHLGKVSEDQCLGLIAECANKALAATKGVSVVFEITAGQGTAVGYRFEHLATLIERVGDKSRVGFCFDTCHAFAAGYDIRTPETYRRTIAEADRIIGLRYLRGVHLNDTKHELGSRKDRHEQIGKGAIGMTAFRLLMEDPRFEGIPLILETPDDEVWPAEIRLLNRLAGRENGVSAGRRTRTRAPRA